MLTREKLTWNALSSHFFEAHKLGLCLCAQEEYYSNKHVQKNVCTGDIAIERGVDIHGA